MNASRWLYVIIALLFVAGTALLSRSLYKIYNRKNLVTPDGMVAAELKRVREEDLATLKNENSDEQSKIESLLRYTSQNLPETEALIKKYLSSQNQTIKSAALEASGAFEWADMKAFSEALNSSNKDARLSALRGISKRTDELRISLVIEHLGRQNSGQKILDNDEIILTKMTLLKLHTLAPDKQKYKSDILASVENTSPEVRSSVYRDLFRSLPGDLDLVEKAYWELKNSQSDVQTEALQYVIAYDKNNLQKNFSNLIEVANSYTYQLVLIDFIASQCPSGWSAVVEKLLANPASLDLVKHIDDAELKIKCRLGL